MEETPLEATPQFTSTPAPRRKINKRFLYLIAAALLLVLLFIGYKVLNISSTPKAEPTPTPTVFQIPTDTPTPEESPTSTPTSPTPPIGPKPTGTVDKSTGLDRSKLSIIIQNGSGEAGVAKKAADYLEGLGYTVLSTTNADNFNYTNVTVKVKAADSSYLNLLKKDLNGSYTVSAATSDLSSSASSDAVVIIGK